MESSRRWEEVNAFNEKKRPSSALSDVMGETARPITVYKPKFYFMNKFLLNGDQHSEERKTTQSNLEASGCQFKDEFVDSGNDTDSNDTWNYSESNLATSPIESMKSLVHCLDGREKRHSHRGNFEMPGGVDQMTNQKEQSVHSPNEMFRKFEFEILNYTHKIKRVCTKSKYEEKTKIRKVEAGRRNSDIYRCTNDKENLKVRSPNDLNPCRTFYWCHVCEKSVKGEAEANSHRMSHRKGEEANLDHYNIQVLLRFTFFMPPP